MKILYLMRHAKSSWSYDELNDHQRPLNDRGRDDAPLMGQALAERNIKVDLLLTSSAVRAQSTAVLVARELKYPHDQIVVDESIYRAEVKDLLRVVRECPDTAGSVLLVGHNNTITDFANLLSPSPLNEMSTGAVVCLHFRVDSWAAIDRANAEFYFYDTPKNQK
ncbi:histidine phosphatase family protein [Hymenobacter sp. BT507]|uniref:Histidine phosphatase family protein n=1 Tax=Hymenobacter citatus TaxID=2763506 RepID=A0ABR7MIJ4_9BACT|nr:histidine phosphatase family protein [Hymenobacter citatus]MBC6610910.1 histidine phosphatase family protein [Hymenobacter citatus]